MWLNGVIAGIVVTLLILVGSVTSASSSNSWGGTQQTGVQTSVASSINSAESTMAS